MRVSFITTVRNEAGNIGDYIRSLSEQTRTPDEVVIVDGQSTDGTVAEIEAQRDRFSRLEVIVQDCNIAEGRNIAVDNATGDVVVMSDAGSVLSPDWVEQIVAPFEADPEVEIVAGNWDILREPGLPELLRFFYLHSRPDFRPGPTRLLSPSARSFAIRRQTWQELGGHPEFLYAGEDTLFNHKWRLQKRRCVFAENAICHWRMHQTWRGFGRQVRNYGRAAGRQARRGSIRGLLRNVRRTAISLALVVMLVIGVFLPWPINAGLVAVSTLALAAIPLRDMWDAYRRAREYGLRGWRAIQATFVVRYGHLQRQYGTLLGLKDRAENRFEEQVLEYMAAGPGTSHAEPVAAEACL